MALFDDGGPSWMSRKNTDCGGGSFCRRRLRPTAFQRAGVKDPDFFAGLELAKQGDALLEHEDHFIAMHVSPAPTEPKP
jgi:hypothetical protein